MTQSLKLSFCNARHGLRKVVGEVCQLLYHFFYFPPCLLPLAGNSKNEMKNNMEQVSHIEKRKLHTMSWCQEPLLEEARPHGNCILPMVKEHNALNIFGMHIWGLSIDLLWYTQHVCNLHSSCAVAHTTPPRLVSLKSGTWMSTLLPLRSRILPVRVPKPGNLEWESHPLRVLELLRSVEVMLDFWWIRECNMRSWKCYHSMQIYMERSICEYMSICLFLLRHKYMYTLQIFRLNQESTYKIMWNNMQWNAATHQSPTGTWLNFSWNQFCKHGQQIKQYKNHKLQSKWPNAKLGNKPGQQLSLLQVST